MLSFDKNRPNGKAVAEGLRRTTAGALALVLSAQLLFANGSATAIAEELQSAATPTANEQVAGGEDAVVLSDDAEAEVAAAGEEAAGGQAEAEASADAAEDASAEAANPAADDAPAADTAEVAEARAAATAAAAPAAEAGEAEAEPADETPAAARSWGDATDNLVLSTDGLALDDEAASEFAAQVKDYVAAVLANERDEDVVQFGAPATDAAEVVLPSALPVALSVKATLDPAAANGRDGNADHNTLLAGDTFEVALPEGVTADLDSDALRDVDGAKVLDVYQADAEGNATDQKVAEAVVGENKLSFKLTEGELPAMLSVNIALDAKLDSAKVAHEASTIEWVLQQAADRKAGLDVPAKADVADKLGLVMTAEELGQEPAAADEANGEEKDVANAAAVASDDSSTDTYEAVDLTGTASFTTIFADNNNAGGVRPSAESLKAGYKLYYTVTKGDETTSKAEFTGSELDQKILGLTPEQAAAMATTIDSTSSNGQYVASASKLPNKIKHTYTAEVAPAPDGDDDQPKTEYYTVTWTMEHDVDSVSDDYQELAKGDYNGDYDSYLNGTTDVFQLLEPVKFNLTLRDGTESTATFNDLDTWYSMFGSKVTITVEKGRDALGTYSDANKNLYEYLKGVGAEFISADRSGTISYKAPAYLPDNTAIDYKIEHSEGEVNKHDDGTCDYYQVSYSNAGVANHGSDITAGYNGGTVYLTRAGTTTFEATKVWLDNDDDSGRDTTTYSLWRYSVNGGSPTTAAQVADSSGKYVEFTVDAETNKATKTINLTTYMEDLQGKLSKYDPDGHPYIYFLRENAVDGYLRVAGTVAEDGTVTYDQAVYFGVEEGSGWKKEITSDAASANSICVYNTGTICNLRTDTTHAEATKTWEAGSYQDQLKDVTVIMTLKRRLKGVESSAWESTDLTRELTGWTAGNFSQAAEASVPRYDALGREYEYRWAETSITSTTEGKVISCTQNDDEISLTSVLKLTDENGHDDTVTFVGSYDADNNTITNRYSGQTVARVTKYWNVQGTPEGATPANPYGATLGADGQLHFTVEDVNDEGETVQVDKVFPASLTFSMYQNNTEYASGLVMDGTVDTEWKSVTASDKTTFYYRESAPWQLDFDGMPKYDASGSKYLYQCFEQVPAGFSASSSFSSAGDASQLVRQNGESTNTVNLTTYSNSPYPGEGTTIRLSKNWVDDGNTTGRNPVSIKVISMSDVTNKAGEKLFSKGDEITTVTLNDANGWYAETGVAASGGYYVAANSTVVPTSGFTYTVEEVGNDYYDVVDYNSAPDVVKLSPWAGEKRLVSKDTTTGSSYAYEISYETAQRTVGDHKVSVIQTTNRRVGLVDVELSKTWVDQGADKNARPDAYYKVSAEGDQAVFFSDDQGIYVKLPSFDQSMKYYLYKDAAHTQHLTTDDATVASDNASLTIAMDKTADSGVKTTFNFYGLPKYNMDGSAFTYELSEGCHGDTGAYVAQTVKNESIYDSVYQHADQKVAEFRNARSGSKDVTYHTRWYDQYVKEDLTQRPDVYITLYRGVVTTDADGKTITTINPTPVTGYESYKWQGLGEQGEDARYAQYATINNLPKYDENGAEYVYYAKMTTSVSEDTYVNLDYEKQQYATNPTKTDDDDYSGDADNASTEWNSVGPEVKRAAASDLVDGGDVILREEGTFIYRLSNAIMVQGTKTWTNIPGDFTGSLPQISVFLQRGYVDNPDTQWQGLQMSVAAGDGLTGAGYDVTCDFTSGQADGQKVVAYTTLSGMQCTGSSTLSTTFTFGFCGKNNADGSYAGDDAASATKLPLYDSNGKRYSYNSREVIDGLVQKDGINPVGGISVSDLIAQQAQASSDYKVYTPTITSSGNGRSFRIDNAFKSNQSGQISVKKIFAGRTRGDAFPEVEFTLYRKAGDAWTKVATKNLDTTGMETNGSGTVTFEDLAIYDPAGNQYEYKVVETPINGYTTYASAGEKDAADVTVVAGAVEGLAASSDETLPETAKATFKNDYGADIAAITGRKAWGDSDNLFGSRFDIYPLLQVVRYSAKDADKSTKEVEVVTLQTKDPKGENYFAWTSGEGEYTAFSISNIEKWAPDGSGWIYALEESTDEIPVTDPTVLAASQYNLDSGSVTADASKDGASFNRALKNTLKCYAKVTKAFAGDNGDAYLQRPRVYVTLQVSSDKGVTWKNAADLFGKDSYTAGGKSVSFTQYWSPWTGTGTKAFTWSELPLYIKSGDDTLTLQYRAVESKIAYDSKDASGNNPGRETQVVTPTVGANNAYSDVTGAYTPSQTVTYDGSGTPTGSTTAITNTLTDTTVKLNVTKTWDDQKNAWGTRPQSVTFLLQRKSGTGTWEWVTKNNIAIDSPFSDEALNTNLVQLTATGGATAGPWSLTTEALPKCDFNGAAYTYRVVEALPVGSGYANTTEGVDAVATSDTLALWALSAPNATGGAYGFTNKMQTVVLSGAKNWKRYGTDQPDAVTLKIEQSMDGKTWTDVSKLVTDLTWNKNVTDGWIYTITGLPKYDSNGTLYQYRVNETNVPSGYWANEVTAAASVGSAENTLVNSTITNTATKFTFNKVDEAEGKGTGVSGATLSGVELTVKDASGNIVAVWSNSATGASVTGCVGCKAYKQTESSPAYIVGLAAGTYTVTETKTPENHVAVADFTLTIAADGSVSVSRAAGGVADIAVASDNDDNNAKSTLVTVTDQVVRGKVTLRKVFYHGKTACGMPMSFDLYKKGENGAADVKIATDIKTLDNGGWGSGNLKVPFIESAGLGAYYKTLADGLPLGSYYFQETGTTPYTVDSTASISFTISENGTSQPKDQNLRMSNEEFNASASLTKVDSNNSDAGVDDAVFKLVYNTGEAGAKDVTISESLKSGYTYSLTARGTSVEGDATKSTTTGKLVINGLKKGTYTLTEVSNKGYNVTSTPLTLKVTNDDQGKALTFTTGGTLSNTRKTGTVSMLKTEAGTTTPIAGATFKLQVKGADDNWSDVAGKLSLTTGEDGKITVSDLAWGTYRFVEVTPTAGYYGTATTSEVTIDRNNVDGSATTPLSAGTVTNSKTGLTLQKTSGGSLLTSGTATFSLTPKDGSAFADGTAGTKEYTTTSGSVTISGELVVGNSYTLKETVAPAGYELETSEVTVTVKNDGSVELTGSNDTFSLSGTTVSKADEPISIVLEKRDSADSSAVKATYTITATDGGTFADGKTTTKDYTTGADGNVTVSAELKQGVTYELTEKSADGYQISQNKLTFEVKDDGTIEAVGEQPADMQVKDGAVSVSLTDPKIVVSLSKSASGYDAGRMNDAVFTVEGVFADSNGKNTSKTLKVGESTELSAVLIANNSYTITETTAPAGFKKISGSMTFKVGSDGKLEKTIGSDAWGVSNGESVTITAVDEPVSVTLKKVAAGESATPLAGGVFELTGTFQDGQSKKTLTTDANGTVTITDQLIVGETYTLTETAAPDGYELLGASVTFKVGDDGSVTDLNVADGVHGSATADGSTITLTDQLAQITVVKSDGDIVLKNAVYTLTGKTSADNGSTWSDSREGLSADEIDDLCFKADGATAYTLTETTAPYGYELITKSFKFVVNTEGTVSGTAVNSNGAIAASGSQINVTDLRIGLSLQKKDATGNDLTGAKFSVSGCFADPEGNLSTQSTVVENVTVDTFSELRFAAGQTYALTETTAPDGYEVIARTFSFTVNDDGTVAGEKVTSNGAIEVSGTSTTTIVATDESFNITLKKTGVGGKLVRGAEFSVSGFEQTFTTGTDGTVTVPGLVAGKEYTIAETKAPAGYELADNSITVKANADGTIEQVGEAVGGFTISGGDVVVKPNEAIRLTLVKAGAAGNATDAAATLDGAVFELTGTVAKADGTTRELKAERVTVAEFNELQFTAGEYALKEVVAPEGFALDSSEFKFKLGTDGKMTIVKLADAYDISSDGVTLTMTDKPIEVELVKADIDGNAVAGAELTLSDQTDKSRADIVVDLGSGAGVWTSGLIGGHTYKVTETKVPAGYAALTHEVTLKVANDGTLTLTDSDSEDPQATLSGSKLTVSDRQVELNITKYSAEGYPETKVVLSGAAFTVTPAEGSTFADGSAAAKDLAATDKDGKASLVGQLVVGGTYTLAETTAPAGYKLVSGSLTFTVATDGSLEVQGDAPAAFTVSDGAVSVFAGGVLDDPTIMSIQKVDASNPAVKLEGATFELTGAFADGSTKQVLTTEGELGVATLEKALLVADGKTVYSLTETKAPAGYELDTTPTTFTVGTDGKISVMAGNMSVTGDDLTTVSAKDTAIEIALNKESAAGEKLSGAKFEIVPTGESTFSDGSTDAREISVSDEGATISGLVADGTYKLSEKTAPEGYKLVQSTFEFAVVDDGTIYSNSAAAGWSIDEDLVSIAVTDDPIELTVSKSAAKGTSLALSDATAMRDAQFSVTGTFANAASESTKTVTIGEDGTGSLESAQLVYGRTYKISETQAPAGFKKLEGEVSVEVADDGTIALVGEAPDGWSIDGNNAQVNAVDEAIVVEISKVGADDGAALLAGAEFKVEGDFADGKGGTKTDTKTLTSASDKATQIEGLVAGRTYTITETLAPAGYEPDTTPTTFEVKEDGTIEVKSGNMSSAENRLGFIATDEPVELKISKSASEDDQALMAGTEFSVTGVFAGSEEASTKTLVIGGDNSTETLARELVVGNEYAIAETKPADGYMALAGTLKVKVKGDGTLEVVEAADGFAVSSDESGVAVVSAKDDLISLRLVKAGSDGASGAAMAGASFKISAAAGSTFAGEHKDDDWFFVTTGDDGTLQLDGALVAGGSYELTEMLAPSGYELLEGTLSFSVSADGRSVEAWNFEGATDGPVTMATDSTSGTPVLSVSVVDDPIQVSFLKTDENGRGLAGAELLIESVDDGEAFSQTVVTDENGHAELSAKLVYDRTYRVCETKAPEGYQLIFGKMTFTVGDDGTLVADKSGFSNGSFEVTADGRCIVAKDLAVAVAGSTESSGRPGGSVEGTGSVAGNGLGAGTGMGVSRTSYPTATRTSYATPSTGDVAFAGMGIVVVAGAGLVVSGLRRRQDE
ncbi:SpaA isopeptide-forming pilin-related protein [Paratractidigestivibacter sp.]|uniref:SpaA isopeptide-forming pilin-related protein n=1 Tax=Paratractidigestivibacter sp. TaxID=2847316 RepID=UPI002ABE9B6C|nr:SpaA isopeptide-forming pilin-related protein [Paratractidigestivibacter sp.]